jgi:hypothetical protein
MKFFLTYRFKLKFVPMNVFGYINSGTNLRLLLPSTIFSTNHKPYTGSHDSATNHYAEVRGTQVPPIGVMPWLLKAWWTLCHGSSLYPSYRARSLVNSGKTPPHHWKGDWVAYYNGSTTKQARKDMGVLFLVWTHFSSEL